MAGITSGPAGRTSIRRRPRSCRASCSRAERVLVNVCWRFWIPLFSVLYRVNNFWNWPRLRALFEKSEDRKCWRRARSALFLRVRASVCASSGRASLLRRSASRCLLSLIAEDLLLLSQHTHIPQQLSDGEPVRPFPTIEQEVFTRSLVFPRWLSALLLHIDAHELHHMYPFVPGYRLGGVPYETENEIGLWAWIRGARRCRASCFCFTTVSRRARTSERRHEPIAESTGLLALSDRRVHTRRGSFIRAWFAARCRDVCSFRSTAGCACAGVECLATTRRCEDSFHGTGGGAGVCAVFRSRRCGSLRASLSSCGRSPFRGYAALGAWAGLGFMLGELPNSFVKRQLDVAPGQAPRGRVGALVSFIVDRTDSIIGMLIALSVAVPTPWMTWLYSLLIGPGIHLAFSVLLYRLGVKARPA